MIDVRVETANEVGVGVRCNGQVNVKAELDESNVKWSRVQNKPFESVGNNLEVVDNKLCVTTTTEMEEDNTKPITSGGVYMVVGNVEALLALI